MKGRIESTLCCEVCNGTMYEHKIDFTTSWGEGPEVTLKDLPCFKCDICGHILFDGNILDYIEEEAIKAKE